MDLFRFSHNGLPYRFGNTSVETARVLGISVSPAQYDRGSSEDGWNPTSDFGGCACPASLENPGFFCTGANDQVCGSIDFWHEQTNLVA